jgi:hypothetical protein
MGGRAEARKRRREIEATRRGGVQIGAQGRRTGPGGRLGLNGWVLGGDSGPLRWREWGWQKRKTGSDVAREGGCFSKKSKWRSCSGW